MAAGNAESGLEGRTRRCGRRLDQVIDLEREEKKAFPFPENPFDALTALEFFLLFPGELPDDNL
jgi:hypothetical protein